MENITEPTAQRHRDTKVCVIQTHTGDEETACYYIRQLDREDLVTDLFIPKREVPYKTDGKWESRLKILFPGYIFVETTDAVQLFLELKQVPKLTKLLADSEYNFFSLTPEEIIYLNRIGRNRGDHIFAISRVEIDDNDPSLRPGDRVKIISGDLLDFQSEIIRYDLHHRKAYLKSGLFGGAEICVGVELVMKI